MASDRDIEKLIRTVTEQVLEHLERTGATPDSWGDEPRGGKVLVLLPLAFRRMDVLTGRVVELASAGHRIQALCADTVIRGLERRGLADRLGPAPLRAEDEGAGYTVGELCDCGVVVLGSVGFALARRMVALEDDDPFVRVVTQALLRGVPVVAVSDDLDQQSGSRELAAEGQRALAELTGLGIRGATIDELPSAVQQLLDRSGGPAPEADGLLTEDHVAAFATRGERRLVIGRTTIVTPLARTRAVELGLEIVRED